MSISCKEDKKKLREFEKPKREVSITFKNFHKDLLKLKNTQDTNKIDYFRKEYGKFFELFNVRIINIGPSRSPLYLNRIDGFLKDKDINYLDKSIDSVYSPEKMEELKSELSQGFTNYSAIFPKKLVPKVAFIISGFNYAVVASDSVLGLSLDMFLGRNFNYYTLLNYPLYKKRLMTPQQVSSQALFSWVKTEFEPAEPPIDLLGEMVEAGKVIYLMNHLLPNAEDSLLLGYSSTQMNWCKQHEFEIWSTFVDKKMLFSTNNSNNQKYVNDAPFSPGFSEESPGKIGYFVGHKIVASYMEANPKVSLRELMEQHDTHLILNRSKYKPKK